MDTFSLQDMHCHLDFAKNASDLARRACEESMCVFSTTVSPNIFNAAQTRLSLDEGFKSENICVGLGFHPWWVSADAQRNNELLECFLGNLSKTSYVGEIGLDAAKRHRETFDNQRRVFLTIVEALRNHQSCTMSLHGIQAYDELFAILDSAHIWDNHAVIFHWFSGSSDDLAKARSRHAYFSVNARMLSTKRGRAYAKAMPIDALLIETDWPPEQCGSASFDEWHHLLEETYERLAEIREIPVQDLASVLSNNACQALRQV